MISEEHGDSSPVDSLIFDSKCPALDHQKKEVWIPSDELTIWIDPLDATKEYTGIATVFTASQKIAQLFGILRKSAAVCNNYGLHSP